MFVQKRTAEVGAVVSESARSPAAPTNKQRKGVSVGNTLGLAIRGYPPKQQATHSTSIFYGRTPGETPQ